ncbi:TIGR02391 family protein [Nocardioides sp.]|uniref:TIGR02391 family protein n=1 Tax=Nocardioides sp. TaxID=35761 RepID=UPI002717AD24|nr:TIGR02391 family protein [Nocardioides sp.]MDO9455220.1 TIGR02391 family protein [Nocardioides sp.]
MDKTWAIGEIDLFLSITTRVVPDDRASAAYMGTVQRGSSTDAAAQAHVVEQIIDRVIPGWPKEPAVAQRRRWTHLQEWAARARLMLTREDEIRDRLGDDAPEMDASRLHPWVWEAAAPYWRTGHHAVAVTQSAIRVNTEAQAKLSRRDISEGDLFAQAFTLDAPKPGAPRLRPMQDDGSKTYQSVHRGARTLAEGLYAGIRNPTSHEIVVVDEQVALEQLAAFSVLARWVDSATVERA